MTVFHEDKLQFEDETMITLCHKYEHLNSAQALVLFLPNF